MAARSRLNILLLWAAIATLASSSTLSPAPTTHAGTVTQPNVTFSVTPQTSTHTPPETPPGQTLNTTVLTAASGTTAVAPKTSTNTTASVLTTPSTTQTSAQPRLSDTPSNAPTQPWNCSYTLVPIQFGFSISINFSSPQTFSLTLVDESKTSETRVFESQTFNVTNLKPCTNYSHKLSFMSDSRSCEYLGSDPSEKTRSMEKSDFKDAQIIEDKVCYKSKWNIPDCQRDPKDNDLCCIKYSDTDICTNFMKSVSSNCNSSITLKKIIDLDPSKITVENEKKYPAELIAKFPPNCNNWTQDYTCSEKESPHRRLYLSQLEPYTNYNCNGTFTHDLLNNVTKTDIDVRIDCKPRLNNIRNSTTNSSVNLSWSLSSSVCEGPLTYTYECSCSPHRPGGKNFLGEKTDVVMPQNLSCLFRGLHAFTSYTCRIHVRYKSQNVTSNYTSVRTTEGTPEKPKVKLTVKDRNGIYVTWNNVDVHGPRTEYTVYLYEGGSVKDKVQTSTPSYEFKGLSYSTEYSVEVVTYNGRFSSKSSNNISTYYNEKPLIGFLVFLIILTCVALSVVTYKIYILRRERSRDSSESMNLISKTNDEERLMFVEPMTAESLLDAYKRKMADEGRLFLDEFQSIPRIFSKYTVKEAKKIHNVPKNRYVDILPYDYNRVQLTSGNGSAGCDYINASFIDGFKETKKYIAAQGPKEETVGDFWRMIWEQQASNIVMVSRCEEGNRVKCAQYWPSPDRDTEIFEEFIIKMSSEEKYPDYIIRHLTLSNKRDKGAEREVTHIQFMSWPDHGVPEEAHLLLKLRRRVNSFKNFFSGPIVIHCSAGVGRTGTYIGIDAMMESLEAEGRVDIYGYVATLRRQRCLMVQVEAQYILIHQALLEHTQFGETESPLQELHSTLNTLKQRSSDNESTLLEDEFDRLPSFKNWRTFNIGTTEENKKKNRSSSVIPYDYNRVLLKLDEGHSHESDPEDDYEMSSEEDNEDAAMYINASLISGYWGPQAFVVAQTPLPNTVADFWAMIVQLEVSAVVMLSDSHTEQDCLYWGKDKKRFEDIEVELESTDVCPSFTLRTMLVHHVKTKASQQVKHFQFLKWGNREVPENAQDLLDLIRGIEHKCGLTLPWRTPVLVHCNDGSSRSGVLCGLWNLLDSAKKEKTVDVFQVVKTLRKERQRMFSSLEQYQFLYEALEVTFPVQNGDVKAAQNSVQIVNETRAAERPCSTTSTDQQEAKESADGDVSAATEEEVSNGSTVTVEV